MRIWFLDELGWATGHQSTTSRHFGFGTISERHHRHDLTIDPKPRRLFALTMNATTVEIPSSHVVMLLHRSRSRRSSEGRGRRGETALKGITNETHAGCDL
jgi:hypothetical protein